MHTTPQTTFDDANGQQQLAVAALREQLAQERAPLLRLPFMDSLLQAFKKAVLPRQRMASLYEFDEGRKQSQRKRENAQAMALLAQIDAGEVNAKSLTDAQKAVLAKYSGTGGGMVGADGKKGSAYEYYTPMPIAEGMWEAMKELGFAGGKVLDPCGGTGIFGAAAPESAVVDAVELNETSGRINQLVNGGSGYSVTVSPFERVAANTPDEEYDAVISNVPFGTLADRGGNQHLDPKYQKEPLESYFIRRSIEKLKPGGIAAFITPPRCVSGKSGTEMRMRRDVAYEAEFIGAFRLPNSVFGAAAADTMTDVIFFRKFSKASAERIEELRDQSPEVLEQAGVLWDEYLQGDYFRGEGKRFVLGELAKGKGRFGEVDVLTTNATVGEIGKMLRKLPKSRIDWELLNATESSPIVYNEGDTLYQRGQLLKMQDGQWVAQGEGDKEASALSETLGKLSTAYTAFEAKLAMQDVATAAIQLDQTGRSMEVPAWLKRLLPDMVKNTQAEREAVWGAAVVGLAAEQVMEERANDGEPVNFEQDYAALSAALKAQHSVASRASSYKGDAVKKALRVITTQYSKKTGFSAFWRGDIEREVQALAPITADRGFEGLRYQLKSMSVPVDKAREVLGADFDPLASDDYCISGDGQSITPSSDYYSGSYGDFLRRINAEIASATDEGVKAKLLRQKLQAQERLNRVDVDKMEFNLFSPHVTAEEKAEFLRRFVSPESVVVYDEATGKARPDVQITDKGKYRGLTDEEKLKNRIGDYLKNGTITIGTADLQMSKAEALKKLASMVRTANEQFNGWVRSHDGIKSRLRTMADDPDKLRFVQEDVGDPLSIEGWGDAIALHDYQNAFVRQQAREFGGGNGFDVGLGKTATALAAVQYVQSIGVKKKTVFVVPGSVLSNWRKESMKAYASMDDCLFVGLREKGESFKVDPAAYDEDLNRIRENRHAKIYMTFEAFERLRLRDQTIEAFGMYMRRVDSSFAEVQDKKKDEKNKGKAAGFKAILANKGGSAPYLEDLGVDSLVIDEGHAFKNSAQTSEFKGGKYLSLAESSQRGLDAQAKAWYVRGQSERKDGVLVLTASPITNSPLEIFSMLALAVGHDRVNDMLLGVQGADNFMQMMCQIDTEQDVTMDGIERESNVFTGLNNVALLRKVVNSVFSIKTAAQVGKVIVVPEKAEHAQPLKLPEEVNERLNLYKQAFRWAIDTLSEKDNPRGSEEAYKEVAAHFGEPMELIGHPFNLINKMNMLVLDPELDQRATFYSVPANKAEQLQALVDKFNTKKLSEKRHRLAPSTPEDAVISRKTVKGENGEKTEELTVHVRAALVQKNRVKLDTIDPKSQSEFEAMAEKMGLDLDVTIPPKIAALLDNYKKERANPRGMDAQGNKSKIVKQIVFCDVLPMHNKIKRILAKRAGTPASAIAIITGKTNNTPEEILGVQDGFNAHGADNKYQTVLANEKAEVGINLQIGTQANHHLTTGWTPDSLQQRNGRSVRQGNFTSLVNVYFYDADGTYDMAKRAMVSRKADWIGKVMDSEGDNRVSVGGGMSAEQMTALIDAVGDPDGVRRAQEEADAKETAQRSKLNRERQNINLDAITKQRQFIKDNETAQPMMVKQVMGLRSLLLEEKRLQGRVTQGEASPAQQRVRDLLADIQARIATARRVIDQSVVFAEQRGGNVMDVDAYLKKEATSYMGAPIKDEELRKKLQYGHGGYSITITEGSPLHAEWEAEIGMAKSMIQEAVRAYDAQSQQAGALHGALAKAFAEGKGGYFGTTPVMDGDFLTREDGTFFGVVQVLDKGEPYVYRLDDRGAQDYDQIGRFARANMRVVHQGDAGYIKLAQDAAAIEDLWAGRGRPSTVFSDRAPMVADYRTTALNKAYAVHNMALAAPHFPYVIQPSQARPGSIAARIFEAQKGVILGFANSESDFVVDVKTEVINRSENNLFSALVAYAASHGLRIGQSDMERVTSYAFGQAVKDNLQASQEGLELLAHALQVQTTTDELIAKVCEALARLAPWADPLVFDDAGVEWLAVVLGYLGTGMMFKMQFTSRVQDIKAAQERAARAALDAQKTKDSPPSAQPAQGAEYVGIKGETKPWKEQIKEVAGKGGFRWDGDAGVWNVRRATWDKLLELYPACKDALQIVEASKKLPR